MVIGVPNDFLGEAIVQLGRTVRYFPVAKVTSNIEGDETINPGPEHDIIAVLYPKTTNMFMQAKEGLYQDGDAYMLSKPSDNVQKNDLVVWEGRFYRIDAVVRRFCDENTSTALYDYSVLFLHEGIPIGPVPGTGRFIGSFRGIPESASKGDWWYDTVDRQYKGHDGTEVIIIG